MQFLGGWIIHQKRAGDAGCQAALVAGQKIEDARFEDQEAPIDPALPRDRLLREAVHNSVFDHQPTEPRRWTNGSDRRELPLLAMKLKQRGQIDITDAVSVGHHEGGIGQPSFEPEQASAGVCFRTGVDQIHRPAFGLRFSAANVTRREVDRQVAGEVVPVEEIALDEVAHVTQCDVEVIEVMLGIVLHDVPQDRPATDLDHRLGASRGFFLKPRAHATCENDNPHCPLR